MHLPLKKNRTIYVRERKTFSSRVVGYQLTPRASPEGTQLLVWWWWEGWFTKETNSQIKAGAFVSKHFRAWTPHGPAIINRRSTYEQVIEQKPKRKHWQEKKDRGHGLVILLLGLSSFHDGKGSMHWCMGQGGTLHGVQDCRGSTWTYFSLLHACVSC